MCSPIELNLPKVRGKYRFNFELGARSWFGTGGRAAVLFIPQDFEDLRFFMCNLLPSIKVFYFGVGSNILVREGGLSDVVLRLGRAFNYINIKQELGIDNERPILTVGAATLDLNLALFAAEHSIAGLEFLSGIPGTIGGALAMNAGAYGCDIASILITAKAINRKGDLQEFSCDEIGYGYRCKSLGREWLFYEATFQGIKGEKKEIYKKIDSISQARDNSQPIKSRTGGSTFKNPEAIAAWELIDNAGCRAMRIGGARISDLHCNFIVNDLGGSSKDIEDLVLKVKARVLENSGVELKEEIVIIGDRLDKKNKSDE